MRRKVEMKKNGKKKWALIVGSMMLAVSVTACAGKEAQNIIKEKSYENVLAAGKDENGDAQATEKDAKDSDAKDVDASNANDAAENVNDVKDYGTYTFSEKRDDLGISVNVDAEVDRSNESKQLHSYEVKKTGISQELLDKCFDYFAKDTEMYDAENPEYFNVDSNDTEKLKEFVSDKKFHDGRIDNRSADNSIIISGCSNPECGSWIACFNSPLEFKFMDPLLDEVGDIILQNKEAKNAKSEVSISEEDARSKADEFIKYLGIEGFVVIESGKGYYQQGDDKYGTYGFRYVRALDGVAVNDFDDITVEYGEDYEMSNVCYDESVTILVDDTGVWCAKICEPKEVKEDSAKEVTVKSFEEAKDIFEQVVFAVADERYKNADVNVDKVTLEYSKVRDEAGAYYIVPVWHFTGSGDFTTVSEFPGEVENGEFHLTINAMDGSVVTDCRPLW